MRSWGGKQNKKQNLVQKTLGLKEEISPLDLQDNALVMNEIDKDIYHDMVDSYDAMAENLEAGLEEYAPFEHLSEDVFNSLFKYNAKLHEEEDMKSFSRLNHNIMEDLMDSESYQDLRKSTKFDLMSSAMGTEVMQSKAMEKIKYFKDQYLQQQKTGQPMDDAEAGELIEQMNQQGKLQNQIDQLQGIKDSGQKLTQAQANKLAQLQQQLMDLQDLIDDNEEGQEQLTNGMTNALNDASKKAADEVHEVRDIIDSWGLESGTTTRRISLDQRKKAIERIRRSDRLKDLTDLIGRMKKIALKKKKKHIPNGHAVHGIELGNKLESVIPSELMKLAHPTTKKDFMVRYHQKQLLQYKKRDSRTIGQGPIIALHDKSGSMQGPKDDWSTALCLASLEVAQKEKRNFGYIPYENIVIDKCVKNVSAGELDPQDILDIAELNTRGGTNFMAPMNEAINCLASERYKKGDILFITDGDCGITDDWLREFKKKKEELQFYVNTVLINVGGGASRGTVDRFSDNVVTISNLAELDDANAAAIFNVMEDKSKFANPSAQAGVDGEPQEYESEEDDY